MAQRGKKRGNPNWRREQHRDTHFQQAQAAGYRARSAYKLLELQSKHKLLCVGQTVVDLGAAPGSWSQVAADLVGPTGRVIAVDLQAIEPIAGVLTAQADLTEPATIVHLRALAGRDADVVLSDAAPNTIGIRAVDQLRSVGLAEAALVAARQLLRPGGAFVAKVFRGADFDQFIIAIKRHFAKVSVSIPAAVRAESQECYVVALNYRGRPEQAPSGEARDSKSRANKGEVPPGLQETAAPGPDWD